MGKDDNIFDVILSIHFIHYYDLISESRVRSRQAPLQPGGQVAAGLDCELFQTSVHAMVLLALIV